MEYHLRMQRYYLKMFGEHSDEYIVVSPDVGSVARARAFAMRLGLGLAIVKHICAVCGAELAIESEFGIGTTVTVVFGK